VVRQSWTFFQNDFAGRIANRIMQTGPALRESVVAGTNAVWYIFVYGGSAIFLMSSSDVRLAIPVMFWFLGYAVFLSYFVPRLRDRSREMSEVRSALTGRIVDSYANILTVKLFARPRDEDEFVRAAVDEHTVTFRRQLRLITLFSLTLTLLNASMVVGTGVAAVWLWTSGKIPVGVVAMALPLTWQIANIAGWVAQNVTAIFENVGVVQDGMRSISVPRLMPDKPGAATLKVEKGAVRFEDVRFGYGTSRGQVDPRQHPAALLRGGGGADPDRRPGHRPGDAGEPALPYRHGDPGYLAAAPLHHRQHPLRPADRDG
jgi:ATP-binding cassette subfamily B multidrug efflux pump